MPSTFIEILDYSLVNYGSVDIKVFSIFNLVVLVIATKLILWIVKNLINRRFKSSSDQGRIKALFQLTKYFVYTISAVIALEIVGLKFSFLVAGGAALLVGLGFGVQSIFNDLVSGVVILCEGTVSVGDVIEVGTLLGKVQRIDMRTSKVETRDGVMIIVPNSILVSEDFIH